MSTILKALKRLETEQGHSPQPANGFENIGPSPTRKAFHRQSAFSLIRSRLAALAATAFAVFVCVLAVFGWISLQSKQVTEDVRASSKQQVVSDRSIVSEKGGRRPGPAAGSQTRAGGPELDERKPPTGNPAKSSSSSSSDRVSRSGRSQGRSADTLPSVRTNASPVQAGIAPTVGAGPQTRPAASLLEPPLQGEAETRPKNSGDDEARDDRYENAQRLTDGRLKIHAIVWAPEPDDRMAVVNNSIVREGESIEGLSIVGIGKEAVYVREDGRLLKVLFGKP